MPKARGERSPLFVPGSSLDRGLNAMTTNLDDVRSTILQTMSVLLRRRADTADPAEKTAVTSALNKLNTELDRLEQAELLDAAAAIANAADVLEEAIGAAKLRPFDNFLSEAQDAMVQLGQLGGEIHSLESLLPAEPSDEKVKVSREVSKKGLPPISPTTRFEEVRKEYGAWYGVCEIRPERRKNVEYYLSRLLKFKPAYQAVGTELNGIPWQFVGIVHGMEAGFDFSRHLHNGDSLKARTHRVPAGRPTSGQPPFTWRDSAVDALKLKALHQISPWSLERMLFELERYNGFGYRRRGLPTPYLWSFSNLYLKGKYVADHEFDPNAVSKQCGAATLLKALDV
jgi:lysozyme family protein